jgi:GNAT superfamily N-acetyltransferase
MTLRLRPATILDAEACARLHRDTVDGSYADAYDTAVVGAWRDGHTIERWEAAISASGYFIVADQDGEIVGCGGLVNNRTGVYIHPRNHRRGIARAIFQELEAMARQRGLEALELSAPERAVPFYESVGFERVGPASHRFQNGAEIAVIDMHKRLA